ncbi:MAG TPA: hypothetical protein VEL69_03500 [Ktedonobacteraceae bacterium]|nr:hypothetical protein [Ktedonobacteraceae bacterium]
MQHQRIFSTGPIVMQTADFQRGFETGLNGGLCGGYRFQLELPVSEESIVAIIRNLCEIAQEGWLSEELLRRDARQIAGWIVLGANAGAGQF